MKEISCDVLVVGAGGAGLRAALAAHEANPRLDVLTVCRGELDSSGVTATACSDRMAFHVTLCHTEPGTADNWTYHAADIYRIGGFVSDEDLARTLARGSAAAMDYLLTLNVPFARTAEGRIDQFVTDGSQYARAAYTGPYTANHIHEALRRRFREIRLPLLEHVALSDLRVEAGHVTGALLLDERTGEPTRVHAPAVVLATGGPGQVFKRNVFPPAMCGEGHAAALRAGASLVNMEFIQLGLCSVKTKLACSGSMMRAVPRIVDEHGGEILKTYLPPRLIGLRTFEKGASWPISAEHPSVIVDVAAHNVCARGGRVFLDYSANPEGFEWSMLPEELTSRFEAGGVDTTRADFREGPLARLLAINRPSVEWLKERGVDVERGDKIEIAPSCQHFQGGIRIRTKAETSVPGLFACGECAGGQHGANRPGGNALMDAQVFGRIAGESAAEFAAASKTGDADVPGCDEKGRQECLPHHATADDAQREGALPPGEAKVRVRELMSRHAGVVRTKEGLAEALIEVRAMRREGVAGASDPLGAAEARAMLLVAEAVLAAAELRVESRGPHMMFASPDDPRPLPRDDEHFSRYVLVTLEDGEIRVQPQDPVKATD